MQGSGWSYDNLNRILTSPGYVYEHDILGNRTWRNRQVSTGGVKYEWDELNRATSIVGTVSGARYEYRADGMRTDKVEGFNLSWEWTDKTHTSGYYDEIQGQNLPTSRYYYDGQMRVEDDYTVEGQYEPVVTVMRYGIGARGIDFLAKSVDGDLVMEGFPMYDGHGNMIATLARSGSSPYFGVADLRSYDVWGAVRSGSTTGDPKQRYCANLGHVQDDESGLIYMRARYYEPWSGRFISQDPGLDGGNWYTYCSNDPMSVDFSGTFKVPEQWRPLMDRLLRVAGFNLMLAGGALMIASRLVIKHPELHLIGLSVGNLRGAVGAFIAGFSLFAAGAMLAHDGVQALEDIVNKVMGPLGGPGSLVMGGWLLLGTAGLMTIGMLLGLQPGDADESVWGF